LGRGASKLFPRINKERGNFNFFWERTGGLEEEQFPLSTGLRRDHAWKFTNGEAKERPEGKGRLPELKGDLKCSVLRERKCLNFQTKERTQGGGRHVLLEKGEKDPAFDPIRPRNRGVLL